MFYGGLRRGVGRRLRSSAHRVGCRRAWQRRDVATKRAWRVSAAQSAAPRPRLEPRGRRHGRPSKGAGPWVRARANRVVADPPLLKIQHGIAPKAALMVQPTAARLPTQKQLDLNRVYIPKARSTTRVPADMTRSGAHRGAQAGGEMQLLNSPEFQHGCTEPL
jgi:hypothetical protein